MPEIPWWVTSPFWWAVAHPAETFVVGYGLRHAPVPIARGLYATGRIMGPATLELGIALGTITYESSAIVRGLVTLGAAGALITGAVVTTAIIAKGITAGQEKVISTLPEYEQAPVRKGFSQALTGTGPGTGGWSPWLN